MNLRRYLLSPVLALLFLSATAFSYEQISSANLRKPDAPGPEIAMTQVGESETSDSIAQGTVIFVSQEEFVEGTVSRLSGWAFVQLVARTAKHSWHATQGFVRASSLNSGWRIPAATVGCENSSDIIEIRAILTRTLLPLGPEDPVSWDRIKASSPTVYISCASFDRGRLEIAEVAWHLPRRRAPIHVSEIEPVLIRCEGLPPGALVQVVVESMNLTTRWVMDDASIACSGGPREIIASVYFGRTRELKNGQIVDLDLNTEFAVYAVATTKRLPVYKGHGIEPAEWNSFSRYIQAASQKVYVDRTVLGNAIRLRIDQLGWSNDQQRFIAAPYELVSGRFEAGKHYVMPQAPETVALLVRSSDEGIWHVAGQTQILRNRGEWVIHIARLAEQASDITKPFIAVAAAFPRPLAAGQAVPDSMLNAALGISDEVSFRIVSRR